MMQDKSNAQLVSIILPTYNRAERLERAVRSILDQTYHALEIIIVDDGSTDATTEVVAQLQQEDSRIHYVQQQNQGLPVALNTGFRASHGAYLTWTSDDNWYHEDAIEIMLRTLHERPTVSFVYCDYEVVDGDGNYLRRVHLSYPQRLMRENCIGACFLYRRRVYEEIGDYDCNLYMAEDYDYWLRVNKRFQMHHIPDVCPYSYGWHDRSITERRAFGVVWATLRARLKNAESWQERAGAVLNLRALFRAVGRPFKQRVKMLMNRP